MKNVLEEQSMIKYSLGDSSDYIDKNMPDWARPTIKKLVDKKILVGDEKGELGLTDEMLRTYVILDRAGILGE